MTLNRDALLAAVDCPTETVKVPELGGSVVLRGMTGREVSSFQKAIRKGDAVDEDNFTAKLLVRCLVDEEGKRLLKDEEFEVVNDWPGSVYQRLGTIALRLNGYDVESAEGNS